MNRLVLLGLLAAAAALVASGCGSGSREHEAASGQRTLTDLHSISQLQQAFNSASGEPRLIVLVSPT